MFLHVSVHTCTLTQNYIYICTHADTHTHTHTHIYIWRERERAERERINKIDCIFKCQSQPDISILRKNTDMNNVSL
jgi:hypothetical protein